jgi:ankyrin repeat protein
VELREDDYLAATPLHLAANQGRTDVVLLLLENGADVNARDGNGYTPMHFAAKWGRRGTVEVLLGHGATNCTNKQCSTPAEEAARKGHHELAALICGFEQTTKPIESVHEVSEKGDLKTLDGMINSDPALVSSTDEDRRTPLHRATTPEVAELLLRKGANPSALDKRGCTPLHIAAMNGNEKVVAVLLSKGSDVNAKGEGEWTPLQFATYMGRDSVAELLRRNGGH